MASSSKRQSCVLYEKVMIIKWGVFTSDPWEVFIMNRQGQAILPFSRRVVPVNLFQSLRMKLAAQSLNSECHLENAKISEDFHRLTTSNVTHQCSTPKSYVAGKTTIVNDNRGSQLYGESIDDDNHDDHDNPALDRTEELTDMNSTLSTSIKFFVDDGRSTAFSTQSYSEYDDRMDEYDEWIRRQQDPYQSAQAAAAVQHNETEENTTNNDLQMMEVTQLDQSVPSERVTNKRRRRDSVTTPTIRAVPNNVIRSFNRLSLNVHSANVVVKKQRRTELQQSLWTEYFHVGSQPDGVWACEVEEKISRQREQGVIHIDPMAFVVLHRVHIEEQWNTIQNDLNAHLSHVHYVIGQQSQGQSIDLAVVLKAFIRRGQHKLNADFECKKRLLRFEYQDHLLTKAFFDLKPTKKEIRSARKIWSATHKQVMAEEQIVILKHRISSRILSKRFDSIDRSFKDVDRALRERVIDDDVRATITNRRNKVIGQMKLDLMSMEISTAEATVRGHTHTINQEKEKLLSSQHSTCEGDDEKVVAATARNNIIINAILARQDNIVKRARYILDWKVILGARNNLLPSSAIVEVATSLRAAQFLFLARGPKYVPTCQSYFATDSLEDVIRREYEQMSTVIMKCLADNCVSASDARATLFFISLKNLLTELYTAKLSSNLFRRSRREYMLTRSIQRMLRSSQQHVVLRRTDKSKVFHLGSLGDYEQKAVSYMMKTGAYEEVDNGKCPLADNLSAVIELLDKLLKCKAINMRQWSAMMPNRSKVELGHLYFLPKPHKIGTPLRPIISSMNGSTRDKTSIST
ncbi:unnamed protein product [Adineta ricciae]|uniref:Uncharacterized protein n=1 Tax=Adineta ricciae TaxID=249248 RepID=A0A815TCG7_ADIRI|nr:unnamed protein product [Adineta ricciae]